MNMLYPIDSMKVRAYIECTWPEETWDAWMQYNILKCECIYFDYLIFLVSYCIFD